MMGSTTNPAGMLGPSTLWGIHNNINFFIQQALARVQTATIVKVVMCDTSSKTVDVQILVNQITGQMVSTPHVTMYGLPYLLIQGGTSGIKIYPEKDDIGIAIFASRDITKVKSTKTQANPGSFRMHDFADGMYLGGLLNAEATQYIEFIVSGINIVSPNSVAITAPEISATSAGGTAHALVIDDWLTWYTTNIQPFLVSKGYAGPPMPSISQTTVFKGQ